MGIAPSIQIRLDAIARDRRKGALELALAALPILAQLNPGQRGVAARALAKAQPAMAPLRWLATRLVEGADPDHLVRHLILASGEASLHAADLIQRRSTVLTHSASSTVERALHAARRPFRVVVTESRPLGEGARFATRLTGLGFDVQLIPDASICLWLPRVNLVLVGADAVTPSGVINKVGTRLLALAARDAGVPFHVVCTTDKVVEEVGPGREEIYEVTPLSLITSIVTEEGACEPSALIGARSAPSSKPRRSRAT